jgi:homoserine O-succinyltransferase/O-acetyltransferase
VVATAALYSYEAETQPIAVALVNNMPDGAFADTEQQFRRALSSGPDGGAGVALDLYTITEIARSETTAAVIRARYRGLDELWDNPPDALIVTGTQPVAAQLRDEPYWPYLAQLLEWAAAAVPTVLLSCLAAHAGFLLFDGIERIQRANKCVGVFDGSVNLGGDPLAEGLPEFVRVPHSRFNEIPEEAALEAGYRIVIGSGPSDAGWAVAARECGASLFVFCQGHPEYSTLSLLREYRRDVRRHLSGRGAAEYPRLPEGYLSDDAVAFFDAFARRASQSAEDPQTLWEQFPYDQVAGSVQNTWAGSSATLYANWLREARRAAVVLA